MLWMLTFVSSMGKWWDNMMSVGMKKETMKEERCDSFTSNL